MWLLLAALFILRCSIASVFVRTVLGVTLAVGIGSLSLRDALAMPASGHLETFLQPDGSSIELRNGGDEWFHWHETSDGYLAAQDPNGFWKYAQAETATNGMIRLRPIAAGVVGKTPPGSLHLKKRHLPPASELRIHIRALQKADS